MLQRFFNLFYTPKPPKEFFEFEGHKYYADDAVPVAIYTAKWTDNGKHAKTAFYEFWYYPLKNEMMLEMSGHMPKEHPYYSFMNKLHFKFQQWTAFETRELLLGIIKRWASIRSLDTFDDLEGPKVILAGDTKLPSKSELEKMPESQLQFIIDQLLEFERYEDIPQIQSILNNKMNEDDDDED